MTKQIKHFSVTSCPLTGEWLSDPIPTGIVEMTEWHKRQDTEDVHYDTYEVDGETRAIEVHWVKV